MGPQSNGEETAKGGPCWEKDPPECPVLEVSALAEEVELLPQFERPGVNETVCVEQEP
jgi:hypothetical protein